MGAVLAVVVVLDLVGVVSHSIEVFDVTLESVPARLFFVALCLVAVVVGTLLVRRGRAHSGEGSP